MNKYKLAGLLIAVSLLAIGLISKYVFGESAAKISLPIMTVGYWAMLAVDTIGYRIQKNAGQSKGVDLARLIGGYLLAVIVTAGTLIYIIYS